MNIIRKIALIKKNLKSVGMTLKKGKEQDGMMLAKVKEQDGIMLANTSSYLQLSITSSDCVLQTQMPLVIYNRQLLHRTASSFKPLM